MEHQHHQPRAIHRLIALASPSAYSRHRPALPSSQLIQQIRILKLEIRSKSEIRKLQ